MHWITRERPKIDRLACPWLISRFIDAEATFHFVPFDQVISKSEEFRGVPFDIPNVEYTHYEDKCTFDYFIEKHKIGDPAVRTIAKIVRSADTDRYELASQAPGLWAITSGLAHNIPNDHELLEVGFVIYDALYSWARFHKDESHAQNPREDLLLEVYRRFLKKEKSKKSPEWVEELREMIQDSIDSDLTLSLSRASENLDVNPTYISREFSKYFDNLNFGDYLRKLRIDKAIQLMSDTKYSIAEISYLTGFSDQSHFTRTFKKHIGLSPSAYKKSLRQAG